MRKRSMVFADGGTWDQEIVKALSDEDLMARFKFTKIMQDSTGKCFVVRSDAKLIYRGPFMAYERETDHYHVIIEQEEEERFLLDEAVALLQKCDEYSYGWGPDDFQDELTAFLKKVGDYE